MQITRSNIVLLACLISLWRGLVVSVRGCARGIIAAWRARGNWGRAIVAALKAAPVALWRWSVAQWREPMVRYRVQVASRWAVACVGGYYLANASASLIARGLIWLEVARGDATQTGRMLGFIIMALAAMWVFGCSSERKVWLGVALPAVVTCTWVWWLRGGVLV